MFLVLMVFCFYKFRFWAFFVFAFFVFELSWDPCVWFCQVFFQDVCRGVCFVLLVMVMFVLRCLLCFEVFLFLVFCL